MEIENLIFLEEMFEETGRLEGLKDGMAKGEEEGYILGQTKGWEFWREVGYYDGFALQCKKKLCEDMAVSVNDHSSRLMKHLDHILTRCNSLSLVNGENEDPTADLLFIRAKFKICCSLLKINTAYAKKEDLF